MIFQRRIFDEDRQSFVHPKNPAGATGCTQNRCFRSVCELEKKCKRKKKIETEPERHYGQRGIQTETERNIETRDRETERNKRKRDREAKDIDTRRHGYRETEKQR